MKRIMAIVLLCIAFAAPAVAAPAKSTSKSKDKNPEITISLPSKPADGPMGIGVFLGQPAGINFQMDLSQTSWVDLKAAWDLKSSYSVLLQGNYEYAFPGALKLDTLSFTPFVGFGAIAKIYSGGIELGVRVPAGISYRFRKIPLELLLEAGFDLYLIPSTVPGGSGGLGARYRF